MKLIELEIHNIRGIRDLLLTPAGESLVIQGPNGTGKSSVVDALDFLLTGRISRLVGRGTGGITLNEHGRHIDCQLEEAWVRGVVRLQNTNETVEIKRCVATPNELDCNPSEALTYIEPILSLAQRGHHILTRRELLKYITAEPKTRAEEIQKLLDIAEVENIRAALVNARSILQKEFETAQREVEQAKGAVNATLQLRTFDEKQILEAINQTRAQLDGRPILEIRSSVLKDGLREPTSSQITGQVNKGVFEKYVENLRNVLVTENGERIAEIDINLRRHLAQIRLDRKLLEALERHQLINLGLKFLDASGKCPLCETPWEIGELRAYLENRLSDSENAQRILKHISDLSNLLVEMANTTLASIRYIAQIAKQVGSSEKDIAQLQSWGNNLERLAEALNIPLERYPTDDFSEYRVKRILAPDDITEVLDGVCSKVNAVNPSVSPELTAWDTLTRLEEHLTRLQKARNEYQKANLAYLRAQNLLENFLTARDNTLEQLFDDIRERFEELYRQLHKMDEDGFTAKLAPNEAGIDLAVDFYNRGVHPPHALHSEGHQDSMGICLYLSLAERLTEGKLDLIILDDVMMSIDADHRRQLAKLLAKSFPKKQFLITTHDKTWASQLKQEGVVLSKRMVEILNWDITTGPTVSYEADLWERIQSDLDKNDVPAAAAKLRRNSEMFFGKVCESLKASVPYKSDGRWELGELLPAAMGEYSDLLRRAKNAAQSWGDQELFDSLSEIDTQRKQIFARSNAEQWAINSNVHYNEWTNFSANDFQPVVEAFQDLYELFKCAKCESLLSVTFHNNEKISVQCNCGAVNWNLKEKSKN